MLSPAFGAPRFFVLFQWRFYRTRQHSSDVWFECVTGDRFPLSGLGSRPIKRRCRQHVLHRAVVGTSEFTHVTHSGACPTCSRRPAGPLIIAISSDDALRPASPDCEAMTQLPSRGPLCTHPEDGGPGRLSLLTGGRGARGGLSQRSLKSSNMQSRTPRIPFLRDQSPGALGTAPASGGGKHRLPL